MTVPTFLNSIFSTMPTNILQFHKIRLFKETNNHNSKKVKICWSRHNFKKYDTYF